MSQALKPQAEFAAFTALDIRVGTVIDVQPFPRARNPAYKITVDFGELGTLRSSGQYTHYAPEELLGRQVICACNFPPRNVAGFQSEILILGARDEQGRAIPLTTLRKAPDGAEIF